MSYILCVLRMELVRFGKRKKRKRFKCAFNLTSYRISGVFFRVLQRKLGKYETLLMYVCHFLGLKTFLIANNITYNFCVYIFCGVKVIAKRAKIRSLRKLPDIRYKWVLRILKSYINIHKFTAPYSETVVWCVMLMCGVINTVIANK